MSSKRTPPPPRINTRHYQKRKKRSFWRFLLKAFLFCFILGLLGAGGAYLGYVIVTPHYKKWADEYDLEYINELERPSIIFDRNGREIGRIFAENRSIVSYSKISPHMINALIAQEDSRFRTHNGFDPMGIGRAVLEFAKTRSINQGASTITQQLARNAFDLKKRAKERNESGFGRKIAEIFLALRIEERYNKEQILEFYLNRVYLGSGFYGIRAASKGYFGKEPIDLTSREAATIAALIKNPNGLSPLNNPDENRRWRNHVLTRMMLEGYLTASEAEKLKKMDLGLNPKPLKREVSHIYTSIRDQVVEYLGEELTYTGGLKIYTTLDKDLQDESVRSLTAKLNDIERRPGYNHPLLRNFKPDGVTVPEYVDGALLMVDNNTGGILAYVGGRDFTKRHYDAIENSFRPPGTAFLPIVYAAAFEKSANPATVVLDDAMDNRRVGIGGDVGITGEWGAESNKNRYEGNISARRALSCSKIGASLRLGQSLGPAALVQMMEKLQLTQPIAEGTGEDGQPIYRNRIYVGTEPVTLKELTKAYTAFSHEGGMLSEMYVIDRINDETDNTIWQSPQSQKTPTRIKAMSPGAAFQVYSILKDSLETGSAAQLKPELDPAFKGIIKTGTNYGFSDNWCMATNSAVTCGVWIGFSNGRKAIYQGAFSVDTAGPVLADVMNASLKDYPPSNISPPSDIDTVELCKVSGKRATRFCYELDPASKKDSPSYRRCTFTEFFRKGDISIPTCDLHGEEGISLDTFLSSLAPGKATRILPVPPVIPLEPVLIGEDPYQSEKIDIKPPNYYQYDFSHAGSSQNVEEIEVIGEAQEEKNDSILLIPTPPKLKLSLPELEGAR